MSHVIFRMGFHSFFRQPAASVSSLRRNSDVETDYGLEVDDGDATSTSSR